MLSFRNLSRTEHFYSTEGCCILHVLCVYQKYRSRTFIVLYKNIEKYLDVRFKKCFEILFKKNMHNIATSFIFRIYQNYII